MQAAFDKCTNGGLGSAVREREQRLIPARLSGGEEGPSPTRTCFGIQAYTTMGPDPE